MFIFGGESPDGTLLNDLWTFDLDSVSWTYVTSFGNKPTPRKGEGVGTGKVRAARGGWAFRSKQ